MLSPTEIPIVFLSLIRRLNPADIARSDTFAESIPEITKVSKSSPEPTLKPLALRSSRSVNVFERIRFEIACIPLGPCHIA